MPLFFLNMEKKTLVFFEDLVVCIGLLIVIIVLVLLTGCCHQLNTPTIAQRDSTAIRIQYKLEYRKGMVDFDIPKISDKVVTKDTTSHLENDYAESDATYSNGILTHTLSTKPQRKSVETNIPFESSDTTIYKYQYIKTIAEVEKPDTWLETTQKNGFWVMLAAFAVLILYNVFKKKIISPIATAKSWITSIINLFKK